MTETRAPYAIPVAEIAGQLTAQIENLCHDLLPHGKKHGHEWAIGGVDGSPGASMMVNMGHRAGVWMDFATGQGGDAIDLIAAVRFGGDKGSAIRWARSWLGLDGLDPARFVATQAASAKRAKNVDESAMDDAERRDKAARMFRGGKSFTDAWGGFTKTAAADYLHGRGIAMRQLGRVPGCLTFTAGAWNGEVQKNVPAMLAAVMQRNIITSVHRTFLEVTGPGKAEKLRVKYPKMSLGPLAGGVIPLWRGDSKLGWSALWDAELSLDWPAVEADRSVTICEGIEDGLSLAIAAPERRIVCTASLPNMQAVNLPPCLTHVTIAADNDKPGSGAAVSGLPKAIARLQAQGRTVRVARAPLPHKDFNAWLQHLQAPAPQAATA
ncbi:MAG: DUF7146 domain-containing protein [Polymorphobacter sp.]